ncbi:MAG: SWIM zinc finger family protein [Hyphomicrobium sp.]
MSLSREKIEGLAPDQASLSAALKLIKPAAWPVLAANAGASILWGECQGSGATPYRVVVTPGDTGYKCTCPSRKFPCKHVLAVLWMCVDKPERFQSSTPPQWVEEWSARRRPGTARPQGRPQPEDNTPKPAPSLDAALNAGPAVEKPLDAKAAARADALRKRVRDEREVSVLAGVDELDLWIFDQLGQGMASFAGRAPQAVRAVSQRLVDAKAGGLAAYLDRLSAELFRVAEAERADAAIERLAIVTLIASAYRRQDHLPPLLREDVRRAAGWVQKREDLLADATAPRVESTWIVAANISEVQPGKIRRLETWLINAAPVEGAPRVGLLVDFVPVSGGAYGFAFELGETLNGEIVFYPSMAPLRGLLATRKAAAASAPWPQMHAGLPSAMDEFATRLGSLPWLEQWPLLVSGVEFRTAGKGLFALADATGAAIPVDGAQVNALTPMLGLGGLAVLLLWNGRQARVLAVESPIGSWHEDA